MINQSKNNGCIYHDSSCYRPISSKQEKKIGLLQMQKWYYLLILFAFASLHVICQDFLQIETNGIRSYEFNCITTYGHKISTHGYLTASLGRDRSKFNYVYSYNDERHSGIYKNVYFPVGVGYRRSFSIEVRKKEKKRKAPTELQNTDATNIDECFKFNEENKHKKPKRFDGLFWEFNLQTGRQFALYGVSSTAPSGNSFRSNLLALYYFPVLFPNLGLGKRFNVYKNIYIETRTDLLYDYFLPSRHLKTFEEQTAIISNTQFKNSVLSEVVGFSGAMQPGQFGGMVSVSMGYSFAKK